MSIERVGYSAGHSSDKVSRRDRITEDKDRNIFHFSRCSYKDQYSVKAESVSFANNKCVAVDNNSASARIVIVNLCTAVVHTNSYYIATHNQWCIGGGARQGDALVVPITSIPSKKFLTILVHCSKKNQALVGSLV